MVSFLGGLTEAAKRIGREQESIPHPAFSSQSAGSVDSIEILLASHRATLHDFMALSYGPARALE